MDITPLFKACVKTVRVRHKAMGQDILSDNTKLLTPRSKSEFVLKTNEIVGYVTRLKEFLVEHRKDYINSEHLTSASGMSDGERDRIDTETQNVIKLCSKKIQDLRTLASARGNSPQLADHRTVVVALLESYLKRVCEIHCEQKAIRTKRILELQKFSKLELNRRTKSTESEPTTESRATEDGRKASIRATDPIDSDDTYEEFTSEEIQTFEQENKKIFEEFNSLTSEIRQIEGKVIEISRLQEVFAEKVLEQEKDIEHVSTTVIGTTENIKDANEEIREAMKKNASFRVWILFFLLVMSFSLLFLDWYNP